ncbi:FCHSD2 [Cordylochernes scorpioides]|uniref:FCHSD2 n=1 Tax=Cordylochernes scorpioides TaxID=51811 RepID=A0ABY6KUL0_9ARAC|nr:FCHSD2 [Cordylochernes scorpioides]
MQEELQQCVQELDKNKKLYFEEEHMAHDAREKAHDAEENIRGTGHDNHGGYLATAFTVSAPHVYTCEKQFDFALTNVPDPHYTNSMSSCSSSCVVTYGCERWTLIKLERKIIEADKCEQGES